MTERSNSLGAAIVGVGESDLGRFPTRSGHALHVQAINAALADAGIDKGEVDGFITLDSYATPRTRHAFNIAQYAGFSADKMRHITTSRHGSVASGGGVFHEAAMMIRANVCSCVVIAGAEARSGLGMDNVVTMIAENRDSEFEAPFGAFMAGLWALFAQRYMADYGATEEDLAEVAVTERSWANLHPKAFMHHKKIDKKDVLASPMIATPFRRLNCAIVTDGGAAFVLTSQERAKAHGQRAVTLLGGEIAFGNGGGLITDDIGQLASLYALREGSALAVKRVLAKAGMKPTDFDVYFQYDPFSITPILFMEALGLCGIGEGAAFFRNGRMAPGGQIPWNTNGGLHSYSHPGMPAGLFMFVEAIRQLRHEADKRQVKDAETAIVQGYGANFGAYPATILLRGQP